MTPAAEEGSNGSRLIISDEEAREAEAPLDEMVADMVVSSPAGHTSSMSFLLDSGSQISLIPPRCLPAWAQVQKLETPRQITTAVASAAATYATEGVALQIAPYPMRTPKTILLFVADVALPILGLEALEKLGYELRRPAIVDYLGERVHELEISPTMAGSEDAEAKEEILAHISEQIARNGTITGPCTHPAAEYSVRIRPDADPTGRKT